MKLNLIYDSKCKINTKWWKIKMKTRNLTQISLRNDLINRRMHGFSFRVSEDKNWSLRCDFLLLSRSNFDFKHSMDAEMHQEHKETNGTWNDGLHKSNLTKIHGRFFPPRRTVFKEAKIRRDRWMKGCIAIYGSHEASIDRNSVIVSHPFDLWWSVKMRWWRGVSFDSPVGFWSNDRDPSMSPQILSDLSRYNSWVQQLRSTHLSENCSTCVMFDQMDLASTASTLVVHRDLDPTCGMLPRRPETK